MGFLRQNRKYLSLFKWLILVFAYSYLLYVLIRFDQYDVFLAQWKSSIQNTWGWLLLVFFLLPLNLFLEAKKWQVLLANLEALSLKKSFQSVLGGIVAAFFTPNRIGEFPGRSMFLAAGNKLTGVVLGFISSMSQTLVIVLWGLPAAILLAAKLYFPQQKLYFYLSFFCFLTFLSLYFLTPIISRKIMPFFSKKKLLNIMHTLSEFTHTELLKVLVLTSLRYVVFSAQFFCLLQFFNVQLSVSDAVLAIATNYLFVTFTPSLAFSEGVLRASIAVLVIGMFSTNSVGIACAGILVWLINFVMPMLVGSYFLSRVKY